MTHCHRIGVVSEAKHVQQNERANGSLQKTKSKANTFLGCEGALNHGICEEKKMKFSHVILQPSFKKFVK